MLAELNVKFLLDIVNAQGLGMDSQRVKLVKEWPA